MFIIERSPLFVCICLCWCAYSSLDVTWQQVSISEEIEWIPPLEDADHVPSVETLRHQIVIDRKKLTIDDEEEFVDPSVLKHVLGVS